MARTTTANGAALKVIHNVDRVNLYDFGYEKSGNVKGDPDVYFSFLNRIINGDLVDEAYEGFTEDEKKERLKQIKELEKKQKEMEEMNASIEEEIKEKEKNIDRQRKDLLQVRETRAKDKKKLKAESFSVIKFSMNLVLLVMLSIYLFFFYISTAYKALYLTLEMISENIANGGGIGSIMPGPNELYNALHNYLLFLVPFVFYAFGWAFHVLLELKNKQQRYLFLSLLIAVTFTVDFLLALNIHKTVEDAKFFMGLATEPWYVSSTFYIILFLGFLVYIIWSILLDSMLREWDKKHITNNIQKIIKHLQQDVKRLQAKLTDITPIKAQVVAFREDLNTVMYGNLKKYIEQFTSGWISYLAPANMKDVKDKCLILKKEFEDKHEIRNGMVKVVSKR